MKNDEWLTPPEILRALGEFDLDPCAPVTRPWETAAQHYTVLDDGLNKPWKGRVWCNPPFGREAVKWLRKMRDHGNGVALIPARTETAMFYETIWGAADGVLFIKGRPHFHYVDGRRAAFNSGAPIALVAYGRDNLEALRHSGLGFVVVGHNELAEELEFHAKHGISAAPALQHEASERIRALSAHVALLKASLAQAEREAEKATASAEPFGYFRVTHFGWEDCAATDDGAIPLYSAPQPDRVAEREAESATPHHEETMNQLQLPELADGETYIGAIGDKNGDAYHLVLLSGDSDPAPFADQIKWAKSIGGDLPNKLEIAMLFANAKDCFKPKVYWTNETFVDPSGPEDDGWAWFQTFGDGYQLYDPKSNELLARAVRRLPI